MSPKQHRIIDHPARNVTDLTARAEQAEAKYRALIEQIPAVVYTEAIRPGQPLTYLSPQVETLTGYTAEELLGDAERWLAIVHPDDQPLVRAEMARTSGTGEPYQLDHRIIARDGREIWLRSEARLVADPMGEPICWQGVWYDITEQKDLEARLAYRARHDSLTNLLNRDTFLEQLGESLQQTTAQSPLSLLFVDLDGFKQINEAYGHVTGDQVLVTVAQRLRESVRATDSLARYGGDEFLVLIEAPATASVARKIAERIRREIEAPVRIGTEIITLTASIGWATSQSPDDFPSDLLHQADMDMFRHKRNR